MIRCKSIIGLVLFAAIAMFSTISQASTVCMKYEGTAMGKWVDVKLNHTRAKMIAGEYDFKMDGKAIKSFCIDIWPDLGSGCFKKTALKDAPTIHSAKKACEISELWGRHFKDVKNGVSAAAFQLAVWEIIYDCDKNVTGGHFKSMERNSETTRLAQCFLDSINGQGPKAQLIGLSNCKWQDQVCAVPLPAAAWMGFSLLGGLGVAMKKKLKLA